MLKPEDFVSYSQHGEDAALAELLPDDAPRWMVDVGANDGKSWSNSYTFGLMGFDLLLVEPMAVYAQRCRDVWEGNPRVRVEQKAISATDGVVNFYVNDDNVGDELAMRSSLLQDIIPSERISQTSVESVPLARLLKAHGVPSRFGILSVDAEGVDLQVLVSVDFARYRPALICVEDVSDLARINAFLSDVGYTEVRRLGPNGIYARNPD